MKVFVLGYKGMLGTYVLSYLKEKKYDVVGFSRDDIDASDSNESSLRAKLFHKGVKKDDVIINCMGVIKSVISQHGTLMATKVNSVFPHILANVCEAEGYKMIHITTDCVFSGNDGQYTEDSLHDCTDVYGKSKSLGEPSNCTVIRTSIIGEEFGTSRSLIEWVKSQNGKTINGYLNHQWNGLTCHHLAKVFEDIIRNKKYWNGVKHIHSPNSLNKYELVQCIIKAHNLNIEVNPVNTPVKCDRSLSTARYDVDTFAPYTMTFNIPDILTQLIDQKNNPPNLEI